jgi:hypothetical protein
MAKLLEKNDGKKISREDMIPQAGFGLNKKTTENAGRVVQLQKQ